MAISIINQTDGVFTDPGISASHTHTVGAGSNRVLIVLVGYENSDFENVSTVVWDPTGLNEPLTEIDSGCVTADDAAVNAFYLLNPTTGTNLPIVVTWDGALNTDGASIVAFTLGGAEQDTPTQVCNALQNVDTISTAALTTVSGDFIAIHGNQENVANTLDLSNSTVTLTLTQNNVTAGESVFISGYGTADAASETAQMDSNSTDHSALQMVAVGEAASSSSSSSSSSRSSSSSSSSESSLSSSSSSATPGEVTWGHHTGVVEAYDEDFTGNTTGWIVEGTPGNDNETIDSTECNEICTFERWYLGDGTAEILIDNYQTGSGPAPTIQYRTSATGAGLTALSWTTYNGVSFISLGWVQIRLIHI